MKKLLLSIIGIIASIGLFAQSPNTFSYQAVARSSNGDLITEQAVSFKISILQGSTSGTSVYSETHYTTTNKYGLVNIKIGNGTTVNDFTAINWTNGPYFVQVKMDASGGSNYSLMGTSQLLSVPYSLHSKTADTVTGKITENQISDLGTYIETETDPSVPAGMQKGEIQYWDGSEWITVEPGYNGAVLTLVNGVPTWEYELQPGEVLNPKTGKIWMDKNLGASQVATSSTDVAAYGDLYQWGRGADGHESRTSNTTSILSNSDTPEHDDFITSDTLPRDWRSPQNNNLWQGVDGINNPCPSGYRLPTISEWDEERESWDSNSAVGAFASPLKLPMAGERYYYDGSLGFVGFCGGYWSSYSNNTIAQSFCFYNDNALRQTTRRGMGHSVRCIKD